MNPHILVVASEIHTRCKRREFLRHVSLGALGFGSAYLSGCNTLPPDKFDQYSSMLDEIEMGPDCNDHIAPARLTVNHYGAVILNSPNMFIADIDRPPGYEPQLLQMLSSAGRSLTTSGASWRVYRTCAGFRAICTSKFFREDEMPNGQLILEKLGSDCRYIKLCKVHNCFRARLTPKPWRVRTPDDNPYVCQLIAVIGNSVHPALKHQLQLHDDISVPHTFHDAWCLA